jgi:peptide/nickel transport system substrate-binding protein
VNYRNPKLDKCIEEARTTVDQDIRMPVWHRCEKIIYEDQPYTFLNRRASLIFVDKRFKNLKVSNFGLNLDTTPLESFVPENAQKYVR